MVRIFFCLAAIAQDTSGRPSWGLLCGAVLLSGFVGLVTGLAIGRLPGLARPSSVPISPRVPKPRAWQASSPTENPSAPPPPAVPAEPNAPPPPPPGKKRAWQK